MTLQAACNALLGAVVGLIVGLWNLLWKPEVPLIITVILAATAAWLSPLVTERLERQRLRSEYVLANLKDLNGLIADIYVDVQAINYEVAAGRKAPRQRMSEARESLAKLNWKLIETAAMLPKEQRRILHDFQAHARDVNRALDGELDRAGCEKLVEEVNGLAMAAAQSIQVVGKHVELGQSDNVNRYRSPSTATLEMA